MELNWKNPKQRLLDRDSAQSYDGIWPMYRHILIFKGKMIMLFQLHTPEKVKPGADHPGTKESTE
jgi:hypothetical protein